MVILLRILNLHLSCYSWQQESRFNSISERQTGIEACLQKANSVVANEIMTFAMWSDNDKDVFPVPVFSALKILD